MKARLFRVSILVLVAMLLLAVPASAGKPVGTYNVHFGAAPIAGTPWTPSFTITWTNYRISDVYYDITYSYGTQSYVYPDGDGAMISVDPRLKSGPLTIGSLGTFDVSAPPEGSSCSVTANVRLYTRRGVVLIAQSGPYNVCIAPQ